MTSRHFQGKKKAFFVFALIAALSISNAHVFAASDEDTSSSEDTVAVFRMYNKNSGEHFYTTNEEEAAHISSVGWLYEGVGWMSPKKSSSPVYRVYNPNAGDHFYTLDRVEYRWLVGLGWRDEGIAFYSDDNKTIPIYREYSPYVVTGTHNYTTDPAEDEWLGTEIGWSREGIRLYAAGPGKDPFDESISFGRWIHVKDAVLANINKERVANGLTPLVSNTQLMDLAFLRSKEIAQDFSHLRPGLNRKTSFDDYELYGVDAWAIGENIAAGQDSIEEALEDFRASLKNHQNLLDPDFTDVGISLWFEPSAVPTGRDRAYKYYWVIEFAALN
ncbi:MAG: CAP domain-containing protein [Lachnospiraceae bacterium]|nr:CAP domain-containing protein [Lachnospiraceae bacterium]